MSTDTAFEATAENTVPSSRDLVSDPVATQSCHPEESSSIRTEPGANNDDSGDTTSCATPTASTPAAATASQPSLLPAATLTALSSPAAAATSLLTASAAPVAARAATLGSLVQARPLGRAVYWDEVVRALTEYLKASVSSGALDAASAERYLEHALKWVAYCENQSVPVRTVQDAERLGTGFAAGWVRAPGRDRRSQTAVMPGPGAQRLRRTAGRVMWHLLRALGVSDRDLFLDVVVPPPTSGPAVRPLDDFEALALRTLCRNHPEEGRRNTAVAGALLGATQGQLRDLLVCDVDLAQGIVRMPGTGKHRARLLVLDDFAAPIFRDRVTALEMAAENGVDYLTLPLLSSQDANGQLATPSQIGNWLCAALDDAGIRDEGVSPLSMALWASLRAFYHGPAATCLSSTPGPVPMRDLDAAAFVRGVSPTTANASLGLRAADNDDPYGFITP